MNAMKKTAFLYSVFAIAVLTLYGINPANAQGASEWDKHQFKSYSVEFMTPSNWKVSINDSTEKHYIECYSPDEQLYFFLTSAENDKNTEIEIILSYLKVTYANSEFLDDERKKINNVEFIFSNGISRMNEIQTYIKLGVGKYKKMIFMIDSGYNNLESDDAEPLLEKIIQSIKGI
jgi:hypothetical protein